VLTKKTDVSAKALCIARNKNSHRTLLEMRYGRTRGIGELLREDLVLATGATMVFVLPFMHGMTEELKNDSAFIPGPLSSLIMGWMVYPSRPGAREHCTGAGISLAIYGLGHVAGRYLIETSR
jgi:hypothetical protein